LQYAEALIPFVNQQELDRRRRALKKQITALRRSSKAAVDYPLICVNAVGTGGSKTPLRGFMDGLPK
jgi:hypothetical protein